MHKGGGGLGGLAKIGYEGREGEGVNFKKQNFIHVLFFSK